jgi:hypothetical protein
MGHADVWIANVTAISISFMGNIESILRILALAAAAGYSIWKWYTEWKKSEKK